jgi:oligopeptide transport system permease protein
MLFYVVKRLLWAIPVLLAISLITFTLMHVIPGGPFDQERHLPPEIEKNVRAKYNLDDPLWKQYVDYVKGIILTGDLGPSLKYKGRNVQDILADTFPVSLQLGLWAVLLALCIGIPLGIVSAVKQNTPIDYASMFFAMVGVSIPNFVLGSLLIYVFAVKLGWLPVARWEGIKYMIMPVLTLGTPPAAFVARLTRASMLEVIRQDYIRTAYAKGLSQRIVILKHALKNSLIPVVTYLGPLIAAFVTGSFIVEYVFALPGMGKYFITSVLDRDYTMIMGTILFYGFILVIMNLIIDILYAFIDPRIRYE